MTKITDLKKRWMSDPRFRKEHRKADDEFDVVEAELVRLFSAQSPERRSTAASDRP